MKRALVIAGLTVAAAVPATFGLIGNASFGQSVPVRIPPSAILVTQESASVQDSTSGRLALATSPTTNLTTITLSPSSTPTPTTSRTKGSGHSKSPSTTAVRKTDDDRTSPSSAQPGDDHGTAAEPGDDHGTAAGPGDGTKATTVDDNGGHSSGSGRDGSSGGGGKDDGADHR
ncbi:hypothetical protein ABIB25_003753 [Nakamurella sp. UYEF19]|uniref:hypothetical protein n=1 Tax=Nakamurella sp. UYEF19 TaxID=1756392 RepID=UPI003398CCFE